MSRFIDADKLKEECYKFTNDVSRSAMAFVQGQINAAPTADVVEVRHGSWEYPYNDKGYTWVNCSECTVVIPTQDAQNYKYCPYCGAKMDGERSDK